MKIPTDKKTIEHIKSLLFKKSNKEIAGMYGVKNSYMNTYISQNGIKRDWAALTEKRCSKCKIKKSIEKFRKTKKGHRADCVDCEKKYNNQYKLVNKKIIRSKAKERYRKNILVSMLYNAKGRASKNNLHFDLNIDFLKEKWTGRCELSGIEFAKDIISKRNPFRPSLDRIDNNKGYTKDNVRIILWGLNLAINEYGLEIYLKIAKGVLNQI